MKRYLFVLLVGLGLTIGCCFSSASALSILDSGVTNQGCCAKLDWSNTVGGWILRVPCVQLGDQYYGVELYFSQTEDLINHVYTYWPANGSCASSSGGGTCGGGGGATCSDCSCADYARNHPAECGATGKLNFRITWHDKNDVDLHGIYNGSEHIYYSHKQGSTTGGKLDVDANAGCSSNVTTRPVENIVYANPPAGEYVMKVCGYKSCGSSSSTVTAQVLVNGNVVQEKTITISTWNDTCVEVFRQTIR